MCLQANLGSGTFARSFGPMPHVQKTAVGFFVAHRHPHGALHWPSFAPHSRQWTATPVGQWGARSWHRNPSPMTTPDAPGDTFTDLATVTGATSTTRDV